MIFGSKHAILRLFGCKKVNFGLFSHFFTFSAIFATFWQNHPVRRNIFTDKVLRRTESLEEGVLECGRRPFAEAFAIEQR